MLHQVLPPLVTAYALFVAMVLRARARPVEVRRPGAGRAPPPIAAVVRTAAGGYVAFLVVVLVFHVWISSDASALPTALWGGAFLAAIPTVAAAAWSWIERRRPRR